MAMVREEVSMALEAVQAHQEATSGSAFAIVPPNFEAFDSRGLPHEAMAARHLLKEYTSGRLLFCQLRPDFDAIVYDFSHNMFI